MAKFLLDNETAIRLGCFFGVLALMMFLELIAPKRALSQSRAVRWYANLGIVALNTAVLRLLFPVAAVGLAMLAADRDWGLFNNLSVPYWLAVAASVAILDFAIYLQHVMVHAVPLLWRLHRMHHADLDIDVTTGARFHPVEIVLSMVIKMAVVAVLGPPAVAVMIFEVLLNATAMFNHANFGLPLGFDRWLRLLVVTPDMHRVHHSLLAHETNSNFGFNLPWWDRLLGTYRDQPEKGHQGMTIGIDLFRDPGAQHLHRMLMQPFHEGTGDYAINRRTRD
ncbi:MAG: sterol desaturase family protein [Rhodospirillales bacterium]|jgi:sterol desaturase/sphingolipid hydroxylase (fatty acid hydroxylase superfamily)|nr:sterol desaturase family protein [Rhodospirillales bacterium]HIJ44460.1 sterol desaturase family protein [Rhodospirillaceae bacterium]MDP7099108.1 sterol desaturase family protein [Rhodospirillales bacterium]MDP7214901.1 sterol desaturase family protein [Rhodospirillales bacterium]HIJ46186.1 sterol desaturase family protein [Rhodospirillaceae bacterium]